MKPEDLEECPPIVVEMVLPLLIAIEKGKESNQSIVFQQIDRRNLVSSVERESSKINERILLRFSAHTGVKTVKLFCDPSFKPSKLASNVIHNEVFHGTQYV